jgi:hypothetical protein
MKKLISSAHTIRSIIQSVHSSSTSPCCKTVKCDGGVSREEGRGVLRALGRAKPFTTVLNSQTIAADREFAFQIDSAAIRFGLGATTEVGQDVSLLGIRNVAVIADPSFSSSGGPLATVLESLQRNKYRI